MRDGCFRRTTYVLHIHSVERLRKGNG